LDDVRTFWVEAGGFDKATMGQVIGLLGRR